MKKRNWRDVVFGMALVVLIGTMAIPTLAAVSTKTKQITAQYSGIKLMVDGVKVTPKDASGKVVEPFIYEGTTYLPVRAVGEALGKTVNWDGKTQTVYIGQMPNQKNYLVDICPPYESKKVYTHKSDDGQFFTMSGQKYSNGLTISGAGGTALMNTNGKYDSMTFIAGHVDATYMRDKTMEIYLDGKYSQSVDLVCESAPHEVTVPLNGAMTVKFYIEDKSDGWPTFGLAEIVLS